MKKLIVLVALFVSFTAHAETCTIDLSRDQIGAGEGLVDQKAVQTFRAKGYNVVLMRGDQLPAGHTLIVSSSCTNFFGFFRSCDVTLELGTYSGFGSLEFDHIVTGRSVSSAASHMRACGQ